jgi:hypothetical protein
MVRRAFFIGMGVGGFGYKIRGLAGVFTADLVADYTLLSLNGLKRGVLFSLIA